MNKVVVFDLGGTLMEFVGMPPSWVDYYHTGFENVNNKYGLGISEKQIETEQLKSKLYSKSNKINVAEDKLAYIKGTDNMVTKVSIKSESFKNTTFFNSIIN